jgi:hypothetical protein
MYELLMQVEAESVRLYHEGRIKEAEKMYAHVVQGFPEDRFVGIWAQALQLLIKGEINRCLDVLEEGISDGLIFPFLSNKQLCRKLEHSDRYWKLKSESERIRRMQHI